MRSHHLKPSGYVLLFCAVLPDLLLRMESSKSSWHLMLRSVWGIGVVRSICGRLGMQRRL